MKKLTSAFLMLTMLALTVVSCKKDDSTKIEEEEDLRSTKMTYKIDGTSKTSTHLFAVKEDGQLWVYGNINSSEAVVLFIEDFNGIGDYTVEDNDVTINHTSGTVSLISEEGTIKVTFSNDNEVKGTFTGTLTNLQGVSKTITEGKFEAKIIDAP